MKSQKKGCGLLLLQMLFVFFLPINLFAQSCVQPPAGIIAWWPFDETNGTTAEDRIGNHPGAHTNGPVPSDGMVGGSLRFDGRNDYVAVADSGLWTFGSNNFTLEFWANFDAPGGGSIGHPGDIFIGHDDGPGTRNKWFFALGSGVLNFHINGRSTGSRFFPRAPFTPTVGEWYHLAITRDGSLYTIYVNGEPTASTTDTRIIPNSSAPLTIGQAEFLGFMNGRLDEVSIYNRALSEDELRAISDAGGEGKCKELQIRPAAGGDTGSVTVTIAGGSFEEGAYVKLVKPTEPDIVGDLVTVEQDGRVITATFNLIGQTHGFWDVVVENLDGNTFTLHDGFAIEEGRSTDIRVNIVGLNLIRPERTQTYHIFYSNHGNVDALAVPLWIAGTPSSADLQMSTEISDPPQAPDEEPFDYSQIPESIEVDGELVTPILVSRIPAGETGVLSFTLTIPSDIATLELRAWANPPLFRSPLDPDFVACITDIFGLAGYVIPGVGCVLTAANPLVQHIAGLLNSRDWVYWTKWVADLIRKCGIPGGQITEIVDLIRYTVNAVLRGTAPISSCTAAFLKISPVNLPVRSIASFDPNDKLGLNGFGINRFVSGYGTFPYLIHFENLETATAPAQEVVITDQIDILYLDLATFSFGPMSFGNTVMSPPSGLTNFTTDISVPGQVLENLVVRITANLNPTSGLLSWRLRAIDPSTGNPPNDPREGFLPPNVNPPEGDGSVLFTITPKDLPTGTEICNKANIVFDTNEPIVTPDWCNTLDNDTPSSTVIGLETIQTSTDFEVQWDGSDVGAGIRDYTIYVSEDGASYTQWLTNTTDTMGVYYGEYGKTYDFYSIARDGTGNLEEAPTIPDTSTTVVLEPSMTGDFNGDGCVDRNDYGILMTDIRNGEPNDPKHDLNEDGAVNRADARSLVGLFTNPRGATCL
jgi:hypothetical protein